MTTATLAPLATEAQVRFITSLRAERGLGNEPEVLDLVRAMTRREASAAIDTLKKLPVVRPAANVAPAVAGVHHDVPAGRYAFTADAGHTAFAQVDRPTKGAWAGRTFVSLLIGAPGDWRKQAMRGVSGATILRKIAAQGAEAAMARYGHEHGECGACRAKLSDPVSIARGIGPVCAANRGW